MAGYSVFTRILGEDLASEVFRKVGTAAKTAFQPVTAFNKAVNEPKTTGLGAVGAKVDQVAGKFRAGLSSITSWLPALGAIGSIATLGGLIAMTRTSAEAFEGLTLSAEKLGIAAGDLAVWRLGAKMTGVENEALDKSLVRLKKNMYDAATGKGKDVALLFQRMKIPLRDAHGAVKNVDTALEDIAEAFKNTSDEEVKSRAALALFGKTGADMLPFLNRGREGIRQWREEFARYSGLTNENTANLSELAEGYKRLDLAGTGLSRKLSAVFAPSMSKIVNWTTNWITANRDLIAQSLERKLDSVGRAFQFVATASAAVTSIPLVAELMKGTDASTAFDVGLGLLGVTMAGPLLSAIQFVTVAWGRMTFAMLGNPVGAALALLALQAWSLAKNWDDNMAAIRAASEKGFGAEALEVFKRFNGVTVIATAFQDLVKTLTGIDIGRLLALPFERAWIEIQKWIPNIAAAWHQLDPMFNWMASHTVSAPAFQQLGQEAAAPYGTRYVPPVISSDPLAAAVNGAAPPQKVEIVLSGEIKAPPGSDIKATVTGGGTRETADVGRSMRPETNY